MGVFIYKSIVPRFHAIGHVRKDGEVECLLEELAKECPILRIFEDQVLMLIRGYLGSRQRCLAFFNSYFQKSHVEYLQLKTIECFQY